MAGASPPSLPPGRHVVPALALALRVGLAQAWATSPPRRWALVHPAPEGLAATPADLRPADPETGRRILAGAFLLAGETLAVGPRGDPWDRPSPSRRFAVALHRFGWMGGLLAAGPEGAVEGLRLTLEWRRLFGRWNAFAWSAEVLERRVFNLACAARALCVRASEAETAQIALDLARQARFLLSMPEGPARAAERAVAAAVAGAALGGAAGERLLTRALRRLEACLPVSVPADGGHASRSPQAALELLFDLMTLDEALVQRGMAAPDEVLRAIDRLAAAVRFFTLADGRLAAFHGGDELEAGYVAAARAQDELGARTVPAARNGYQRLEARSLQIVADAAAAPAGPWSVTACGQPLAIEVLAGARRLIVGAGWSPDAQGPQAMRLVDAASTASLGDAPCGEPLRGFPAQVLGPRLVDGYGAVETRRHEAPGALWLELAHDGWAKRFGLRHERRLYIDIEADELRGEDRFTPVGPGGRPGGRRFAPFMVRFHLHPEVSALISRDKKSVLLKPEGQESGWWLRNDAIEVAIEPSLHYHQGQPRRSQQIVLRGQARLDAGARVRWKLSAAARGRVDGEADEA
ncbi:heparinase II/III family protein [Phenylobacterium hankyongense]|uniref:heparinase II/III family protein n=1 Tax=Phenylobacterium hankyongense TaxID=1813876 RepID=UPI001057C9D2|nr:heparinase II/III family protein [Phenylobacterium hankyongense]